MLLLLRGVLLGRVHVAGLAFFARENLCSMSYFMRGL